MRGNGHQNGTAPRPLRCAIYTRKSTEEGLDSDFNSLDAQREAAEAFVLSQKGEGWTALPHRYDDGGFSGGNMDRPAIRALLADIEAKRVDAVVVYKVDRLSRSLLDFTKILEVLNAHGVVFVSVTQQFNTATSAGRLMLNVLLSFAQFEREMIAERTRDKMSAARKKGRWVGGMLVLGYDVDKDGGKVVVNETEAERVRAIFDLFLKKKGRLVETVTELNARGWTTKSWVTKKSRNHAGGRFDRVNLRSMLRNVIYVGKVCHQGTVYPGAHQGIVEPAVFERVQAVLRRHVRHSQRAEHVPQGTLLEGLLRCGPCDAAMAPTYTDKRRRRYRYYVCDRARREGRQACPTKSVAAAEVERIVAEHVCGAGTAEGNVDSGTWERVRREVRGVTLSPAGVEIVPVAGDGVPVRLPAPARGRRRSRRGPLRAAGGPTVPHAARALALAHRFDRLLRDGTVSDRAALARLAGLTRARVSQLMNLLCLAPDIQESLLTSTPAPGGSFPARRLIEISSLPDWSSQRDEWTFGRSAASVGSPRRHVAQEAASA